MIVNNEVVVSIETREIITGEPQTRLLEKALNPILSIEEILRGESKFYHMEEFREVIRSSTRSCERVSEILVEHIPSENDHPYLKEDKNFVLVKITNPGDNRVPKVGYIVFYPTRDGQKLE